jgi:hypothetical protein
MWIPFYPNVAVQFNTLVTELGAMVSASNRKMDKTTVLKTTIAFLRQHEEMSVRNQAGISLFWYSL